MTENSLLTQEERRRLDDLTSTALRITAIEMVQKANSGHPGAPLGMAPVVHRIYSKYLKHQPKHPLWFDRDRFVLSGGHGSALLYSTLHYWGNDWKWEELQSFRQLNSPAAGHPEYNPARSIETTTGPLGQGIATAVGMAIAERYLAETFNREDYPIIDHYTYVYGGDGDFMEGVSGEASSLAGHLGLGRLILFYDDNKITIDGSTDESFSEDVGLRYESYGWSVFRLEHDYNMEEFDEAIEQARADLDHPSLIIVPSEIGYGSPKAGSSASHGAPLGEENVKKTKEFFGWPEDEAEAEELREGVRSYLKILSEEKRHLYDEWLEMRNRYAEAYPKESAHLLQIEQGKLPKISGRKDFFQGFDSKEATRNSSHKVINRLAAISPFFLGGSADLAGSNKTLIEGEGRFSREDHGNRNIYFGVREHAMAAIGNGLATYGLRPFVATFLIFSDYLRGGLRLSALMKLPVIYVLTHDSIGVGEDGPTHEPIEQLSNLRAIPDFEVWRPADGQETAHAYAALWDAGLPGALALSRQSLPALTHDHSEAGRGGYIASDSEGTPELIYIATGSELHLTIEAAENLRAEGYRVRVVSMPCQERFEVQSESYREKVLPAGVRRRVAVEAGRAQSWYRYVSAFEGAMVTMESFGKSAPGPELMEHFGFTVENVTATGRALLERQHA